MRHFILTVLLLFIPTCAPAEITSDDAVRAIIGEAENQGYEGMKAVACGILNRPEGLEGVYGAKNGRYKKASFDTIHKAMSAWEDAKNFRIYCKLIIGDADMWENVNKFGQPKNWPPVVYITTIGDHRFYRRIISEQ